MRSSKSRSRSKSNRSRGSSGSGGGNVVNRVFDSSGPEGKVRGTPQQIIEKYNQLARDAQLAGDRVATENFQQHAEHYLRLLSHAQREQDQRREEQERQNRERQAERDRDRERHQDSRGEDDQKVDDRRAGDIASEALAVSDGGSDGEDSGLVETPESKPKKPATRKPRARKAAPAEAEPAERLGGEDGSASEAAQ